MTTARARRPAPPESTLHTTLRVAILRAFFAAGALAAVVALLSLVLNPVLRFSPANLGLLLAYAALGAGSLWATRLRPRQALRAMMAVALGVLAAVGSSALVNGYGLQAPGLVFFALLCCMCAAVAEARHGLMVGAAALAVVSVLAAAEATGLIPPPPSAAQATLSARALVHLAAVAIGTGAGRLLARLLAAHVHDAAEREQRFHGLLGIAASAYWETDEQLRMRHVSQRDALSQRGSLPQFVPMALLPRRPPWELPELQFEDDALDVMRADMEAREAFRDLSVSWCPPDGETRHFLVSGEPQRDAEGRFVGYWGVARDVTADQLARQAAERALRRSQALLSQVVSMSPDVITLTDMQTGRYEMVNASFSRVTGYAAAEVEGRTSAEVGIWRHEQDRHMLLRQVVQHGSAQDVGVDFVRRDGGFVRLLVSAARFERDGRAFIVINARDMSESSRTRLEREAILDNASISIAFTRERRFVMVNPHFERMYGWPPGGLVGQPGRVVWSSDSDYDALGREVGAQLRSGEQVEFERLAARRDGSTFLVRMRAKAIDPDHPNENGTIWIAEDVTAQRQAEAALARARDDAEAANRAKSAFLANTSHEIRTPLNGLVGLARLARQPNVDTVRLKHYLEQIGASAETLSAIISDILDLSKIEAGKLDVETAAFDLLELLHSLEQAYAALADSHGLAFQVEIDPRLPLAVRGDALRVRQILANFLQNAMKFTPRGSVRLVARPTSGDGVRFEVHDTGLGIDAQTQARLFKPFTQADESITRRFGGTGLGLSICRELAGLMGGAVGVSSDPGRGSCFWAELPLPQEHDIAAVSGHGPLESDPLHGARVLLVEDNAVNMMIGVALLEQWGAVVWQAGDGPQALAAVADAVQAGRLFDVVLMDVQMPGMSGYEATRLLRQHYTLLELPIIALTAAALTSERERATEIGMNDFLTKPIDANRMRITL
ncbi:PAS domain-containing hybrid sensor histidine kinase/response regulator, partial [Aquabacterium sp.]|uniref:PAS domain-containing hybrid sensor histidine kinase/response regulator n=1 Tax=Aquabacterium sp. TaxID=1872578 RepID=UPI002C853C30